MFFVRKFRARLWKLWQILKEPKSLWIGLAISITILYASLFISSLLGFEENRYIIAISGAVLQLMGIITIVLELDTRKRVFTKNGLLRDFLEWFDRFLKTALGKRDQTSGHIDQTLPSLMKAQPRKDRPLQGDTLEEKVHDLHKRQEDMRNQMELMESRLVEKINFSVKAEYKERTKGDEEIKKLLKEATIGGFHIEMCGVIFLMFGVVYGTIPGYVIEYFPYMDWITGP